MTECLNEAEESNNTTLGGKEFHWVVVFGKNELLDCASPASEWFDNVG